MNASFHNPLSQQEGDPYSVALSRDMRAGLKPVIEPPVSQMSRQDRLDSPQRFFVEHQRDVFGSFTSLPNSFRAGDSYYVGVIRFGLDKASEADTKNSSDLNFALEKFAERLNRLDISKFACSCSKSQATLFGRVESIVGDVAIVSLLHEKTGDLIEAECAIDTLVKEGINEGDEFACKVVKDGSTVSVRFEHMQPNKVTAQRIAEILKEVEDITF